MSTATIITKPVATFEEGNEAAHPEILKFMESIEADAELAAKGEQLWDLASTWRRLRGRRPEIEARVRQIDAELITATGKSHRNLLDERASLTAESSSLPTQRAEVARRCTFARLAFFRHLCQVADRELVHITAELRGPIDENNEIKKRLHQDDGRRAGGAILSAKERADMFSRSRAIVAEINPLVARQNRAELLKQMAHGKAREYGPEVYLHFPSTHEIAAERAARAASRG